MSPEPRLRHGRRSPGRGHGAGGELVERHELARVAVVVAERPGLRSRDPRGRGHDRESPRARRCTGCAALEPDPDGAAVGLGEPPEGDPDEPPPPQAGS